MYLNGELIEAVEFTAPNVSTWMTYIRNVNLNAGDNEIVIEGSWNWMSFDYIAIAVEDDGSGADVRLVQKENQPQLSLHPNPSTGQTSLNYLIPEAGFVTLEIFDISGKKFDLVVNELKSEGQYSYEFSSQILSNGQYLVKLSFNSSVIVKPLLVLNN